MLKWFKQRKAGKLRLAERELMLKKKRFPGIPSGITDLYTVPLAGDKLFKKVRFSHCRENNPTAVVVAMSFYSWKRYGIREDVASLKEKAVDHILVYGKNALLTARAIVGRAWLHSRLVSEEEDEYEETIKLEGYDAPYIEVEYKDIRALESIPETIRVLDPHYRRIIVNIVFDKPEYYLKPNFYKQRWEKAVDKIVETVDKVDGTVIYTVEALDHEEYGQFPTDHAVKSKIPVEDYWNHVARTYAEQILAFMEKYGWAERLPLKYLYPLYVTAQEHNIVELKKEYIGREVVEVLRPLLENTLKYHNVVYSDILEKDCHIPSKTVYDIGFTANITLGHLYWMWKKGLLARNEPRVNMTILAPRGPHILEVVLFKYLPVIGVDPYKIILEKRELVDEIVEAMRETPVETAYQLIKMARRQGLSLGERLFITAHLSLVIQLHLPYILEAIAIYNIITPAEYRMLYNKVKEAGVEDEYMYAMLSHPLLYEYNYEASKKQDEDAKIIILAPIGFSSRNEVKEMIAPWLRRKAEKKTEEKREKKQEEKREPEIIRVEELSVEDVVGAENTTPNPRRAYL